MTRVYIAASSREVERVSAAQALAREWGWELTLDWLTPMLEIIDSGRHDTDLSVAEQRQAAQGDLDAIERADLLWLLSPREPTKGAWWEAGHAHAHRIPVVVSGCTDATLPSIFVALCDRVAEDHDVKEWWDGQDEWTCPHCVEESIVAAASRLVALWDAESAAQADPTRTSAPAATSPPRHVLTAARKALRVAVRRG